MPEPVGPGDEHQAVRLRDHPVDQRPVRLAHAEADEIERQRALVEQTHDHALAVERRDGRDADVDLASFEPQGDVAVLRDVALGDVHVRHDLHATDQGRLEMLRRLRLRDQHAVDPVLDPQLALERLDVDVRRAGLDRLEQQQVHQIDERRLLRHPVDVFRLDGVEIVFDVGRREAALVGEALRHAGGGGAVAEPHEFGEGRLLDPDAADRAAGHRRELVHRGEVGRIGHGDDEPAAIEGERHRTKSHGDIGFKKRERVFRDGRGLLEPIDPKDLAALPNPGGGGVGGQSVGVRQAGGEIGHFGRSRGRAIGERVLQSARSEPEDEPLGEEERPPRRGDGACSTRSESADFAPSPSFGL